MQITDELTLSYYKPVADINKGHHVQLVLDTRAGKFFVKKQLTVYDINVFRSLQQCPAAQTPRICELVEEDGLLTVIEEYRPGDSLQELLDQKGVFSERQALDLILQLCRIVSALHHRAPSIIHRDIKPSNLILSSDGILSLLDFNAAKFSFPEQSGKSRDTRLLGTTGYAAPEQYGFGVSAAQTDLYAIGVLLNVLLTGHIPTEEPARGSFAPVIAKCTRLEPAERYADVDLLIADLMAIRNRFDSVPSASVPAYNNSTVAFSSASAPTYNNSSAAFLSAAHKNATASVSSRAADATVSSWRRFLPPGFRTGNPLHILVAIMGYLMIFYIGCSLQVENATPVDTVLNRIVCTIMFLFIVFFSCNYANIQEHFPPANSKKRVVRIVGIVLYDFLFMILFLLVLAIVENLFLPA